VLENFLEKAAFPSRVNGSKCGVASAFKMAIKNSQDREGFRNLA